MRVSFALPTYTAVEGEPGVPVTVRLSRAPGRTVTVPLTATSGGGATAADYEVQPASATFDSRAIEATVTVTAVDDAEYDDGESVVLGFDRLLPARVSAGDQAVATVILSDRDPAVTASFARATYAAAEGGQAASVTVRLSAAPGREVTIPLTAVAGGGATAADYTLRAETVMFTADATEAAVAVTATADGEDDDGEMVSFALGALPPGVTAGSPTAATVTIADADGPRFTDELSAGGPVRAVHLTELRLRTAALRLELDLAPFRWTDAVIMPGVTPIRAVHLTELRTALDEAYEMTGQQRPRYAEVGPGVTPIRAAHFVELRDAVVALEHLGR